jgi:hypothetical protein
MGLQVGSRFGVGVICICLGPALMTAALNARASESTGFAQSASNLPLPAVLSERNVPSHGHLYPIRMPKV